MKINLLFILFLLPLPVRAAAPPDYLAVAKRYADVMIGKGRDRYGDEKTPLFAVALDRGTLSIATGKKREELLAIERGDWGIRPHDRMVQGANPMQDQNLYRLLYALSETTGDTNYAVAADEALDWFFRHCQSPSTGLFAWGEHIGWDFETETVIEKDSGFLHEFARPWMLWERSFMLAPDACAAFAHGLWDHQIADQGSAHYSRHARYDVHGPGKGSEYPRHGGFYIAAWASAYEHTQDPVFLEAIGTLTAAFQARRHYKTDALLAETQSPELMWPNSNVSLAYDLWNAAAKVPAPLAETMRDCARRTDNVFLAIPQDLSPKGRGFMLHAVTSTLEVGWLRGGIPNDTLEHFTRTWATGYGEATDAQVGMLCWLRWRQVGLEGYKKLFLDTAARYMTSEPDTTIALYPGAVADAIALMLSAYRTTGDRNYLDRADHFGRMGVRFFFDGESGLPRASSKHDHYEAITRGDTLALELLDLWLAKQGRALDVWCEYNER